MKKNLQLIKMRISLSSILCFMVALMLLNACDKSSPVGTDPDPNPGPDPNPYPVEQNTIIATSQLRALHTGQDITLTKDNMSGAHRLAVVVTSDHSAGNLPDGWLIAQDRRHQGILRGITIPLDATEASKYVPGDSLVIDIEGGLLTRVNGHLQLTNIAGSDVTKIASRRYVGENRLSIETILANPDTYESTFVTIASATGFIPATVAGDKLSGNKVLGSATAQLTLSTRTDSPLADRLAPYSSRFSGVLSNTSSGPALHLRTAADMDIITGQPEPEPEPEPHPDAAAFVISGWLAQATGGDVTPNNTLREQAHEYMQFLALRDIDFSRESFSVITCNNAGQSAAGVAPLSGGWVTGGARTYKFRLTSGTVTKGEYFYVGGNGKKVNGVNSVNAIPDTKWIVSRNYAQVAGDDDIGNTLTNLFANSGLTYGIAAFKGTDVNHDTEPMDVVFLRNPDPTYILFGKVNGENRGYRLTKTDYFNPTGDHNKYLNQYDENGNYQNTEVVGGAGAAVSTLAAGAFLELRGIYNVTTAEWSTSRSRNVITLDPATSTVNHIETVNSTKMTPAP